MWSGTDSQIKEARFVLLNAADVRAPPRLRPPLKRATREGVRTLEIWRPHT